jgi:isoquinoline 1-oxidoreductase beta subunit
VSALYKVTRRDFLRDLGVGTGALVLGCSIAPSVAADGPSLVHKLIHGFPVDGVPFVEIKINGDVVIITHRAEMGQGIRSSLAAVLAEELEADWSRVTLRQADADSTKFGVPFPFDVPPEAKLPRPYDRRDPVKPYIVAGDVAQFTDSSRSMAAYYTPMRLFGAGIRLVMIRAGAKKFGVPADECYAEQHKVIHRPSGRSVDYKWLALRAKKEKMPTYEDIQKVLKKPQDWRFIGKKMPFVDAPDMVSGRTKYCADIELPGMLTAMIERCPVANGDVKDGFDDSEVRAMPGVVDVIKVRIPGILGAGGVGASFAPHAGVAVLARNTWAALQGRRKLRSKLEWDLGSPVAAVNAKYDSDSYRRTLEAEASTPTRRVKSVRSRGEHFDAAIAIGKPVEASYYVPHLAQTPMEPPVAIALFEHDHLEVWAPTQNPDMAQQMAGVVAFGIPVEKWALQSVKDEMRKKVTLHATLLGGGFGRKSKPDYIAEAAFLASKHPGVPIRVQWTREDDIKFSYFNAVSAQYLKARLGADGHPTALLWRSAFPSIFATLFPPERSDFAAEVNTAYAEKREAYYDGGEYPYGSGIERAQGLEDMPFNIDNIRIENCAADSFIRVGWMRAVANLYHAFAICSFADEMAKAAGRDSKDYLLDLIGKGDILRLEKEGVVHYNNNEFPVEQIPVPILGGKSLSVIPGFPPDTRRLRRVVEEVAKLSGWDEKKGKLPKGRGMGIAAHRSFLTYVALVLDVSLDEDRRLTIHEAYAVVDCGLVVNPDRVRAQVEGGINYGLSMALLGEITVKDGRVEQNNFDDYPVLRIDKAPKKFTMSFVVPDPDDLRDLNREVAPTGVGEPPTPVVAPALANAIVAAGGPRIYEIPFRKTISIL